MRFEGWDVMIFPFDTGSEASRGPVQEFRVQCDVVPDTEFSHTHASLGIPTVTSFIASLAPGSPFKISIHSWTTPEVSRYARAYSRHPELVKIEARVLIDGRLVASCAFHRTRHWPQHIVHTFDVAKNGDLEPLRFPPFRREMLSQQKWNPGDDMGRIKVILSEGFPRESVTMPVQRVKNIVAFSFQHAPLDVLENVEIAWPNQAMWTRPHLSAAVIPAHQSKEGSSAAHAHSPRGRHDLYGGSGSQTTSSFGINCCSADTLNLDLLPTLCDPTHQVAQLSTNDVFTDAALYSAWMCHNSATTTAQGHNSDWFSQKMRTDTSLDMAIGGFVPAAQRPQAVQLQSDMESVSASASNAKRRQSPGELVNAGSPASRAPANTPTNESINEHFSTLPPNNILPADLAVRLTNSLLNQPAPLSTRSSNRNLPLSRSIPVIKTPNSVVGKVAHFSRHSSSASAYFASPVKTSASKPSRIAETIDLTDSNMSSEVSQMLDPLPNDIQESVLKLRSSPAPYSPTSRDDDVSLSSNMAASSARSATPIF